MLAYEISPSISLTEVSYSSGLVDYVDSIIGLIKESVDKEEVIERLQELSQTLEDIQAQTLTSSGKALSKLNTSKVERKGYAALVINLRQQGHTYTSIAKSTGISAREISNFIKMYDLASAKQKSQMSKRSITDTYACMQELYERVLSQLNSLEGVSDKVAAEYTESLRKLIQDGATWEKQRAENMKIENVVRTMVAIINAESPQVAKKCIEAIRKHYAISEQALTPYLTGS
jgi:uncharacterized protein YerC